MFVAIDRTCKFAYAELHPQALKTVAAQFLRNLIAAIPYKIHTILAETVFSSPTVSKMHMPFSMSLGVYARSMALSIASPKRIIPGPRAKSSA